MNILPRLIFLLIGFALSLPIYAGRDVTQVNLKPGDGNWSLGVGFRGGTFPYYGEDKVDDLLPLFIYNGEEFFIDGTRAGYHFINTDEWLLSGFAAYRFGGFNEEDSDFLDGMERDDSVEGRLAITRLTPNGNFTFDIGADASGQHNGWDAQLRYAKRFQYSENLGFRLWLGLTYESEDLTNYYFGVRPEEASDERPFYETTDAFEWQYGADVAYRVAEHHYVGLNIQYSQLDGTKIDSPIVADTGVFSTFASYRYEFNDFKTGSYKGDVLEDDFKEDEWYWRVAAGWTTEVKFNEMMTFRNLFNNEEKNTGLASIFVGKKISERFMGVPLEVYLTGGYVRRFERGYQKDFNEYVMAIKLYYSDFPWSDKIKTRVGFAEGLSYAEQVPIVEEESVTEKNRSASKFLNYLDYSWDVSIGDVIGKPELKECYFGWSIHHRSGIFANADFFGNVDGGGNVNTLYVQCHH